MVVEGPKATLSRTVQFKTARIFRPLLEPSRYKGAYGGRGGAKSNFFGELLLESCLLKTIRAVCLREIQRSLEQSVKRLLEDKIQSYGLGKEFKVMNTHIVAPGTHQYKDNDLRNEGIIIFNGMQNHTAESIKSLEGFDLAWFEEAQSCSDQSLSLLRPTIRRDDSEMWFSWNPRHKTDPIDVFLRGATPPPRSVVISCSYHDNPWFPPVLREEMEYDRNNDHDKYKHIWLGGYEEHSESRVFKNWKVEEFDEPPSDTFFMYGGDWGYSVDPTVAVRGFVGKESSKNGRKRLYIDREVYKIGCEIDHIPALFDTLDDGKMRMWTIIVDSARPETISYVRRHGYPMIRPAYKGPNSVKEGVIFLQSYDIVIHPRCVHTIDEFTMYSYKTDPLTNLVVPILEDKKNHVIDSARYMTEPIRKGQVRQHEAVWG